MPEKKPVRIHKEPVPGEASWRPHRNAGCGEAAFLPSAPVSREEHGCRSDGRRRTERRDGNRDRRPRNGDGGRRDRPAFTPKEFRDRGLFLPMSREDMERRGWDELDVLLVSGDAYVDHPAFGVALLGRWLESHGYRVGIVAQPRWDTVDDIARMGRPRLFAGVTAGAVDSMLAHYTAFRKKRHDDAYTRAARPGRARTAR